MTSRQAGPDINEQLAPNARGKDKWPLAIGTRSQAAISICRWILNYAYSMGRALGTDIKFDLFSRTACIKLKIGGNSGIYWGGGALGFKLNLFIYLIYL